MKKGTARRAGLAAAAAVVAGALIAYGYTADQARQRGFEFGAELERIQDDVKALQDRFYSEKARWEEGGITRAELLGYYDSHVAEFRDVISRYDGLDPPAIFEGSVDLLRLSSESQLEADREYIAWMGTGDEQARTRSDARIQESLEYELRGLAAFYAAKTGAVTYDGPGEFEAPEPGLARQVARVAEGMAARCDAEFGDGSGGFASEEDEAAWSACVAEAQAWRAERAAGLP